jgi:MFS transporter, AAHS family, 4-hydroxybenzoate transporter
MGRLIDRIGFRRVLISSFLFTALTIAVIRHPGIGTALLFATITIAGFCVVDGRALAASYYPPSLRHRVGWSLGFGRFG